MGFFESVFKPNTDKLKRNKDIKGLINALRHNDLLIRKSAVMAIGEICKPDEVNPLIIDMAIDIIDRTLKEDKELAVREAVVQALAIMKDTRAIDVLIAGSKDRDFSISSSSIMCLKRMVKTLVAEKDSRALIPLLHDLRWRGPDEKVSALKELDSLENPDAVGPIIEALRNENSIVRQAAADALGEIKDIRAVELLIYYALKDEKSDNREAARKALRKIAYEELRIKGQQVIEFFIKSLNDNRSDVRWAAMALRWIGDSKAIKPLIATLENREREIQVIAAQTLVLLANKYDQQIQYKTVLEKAEAIVSQSIREEQEQVKRRSEFQKNETSRKEQEQAKRKAEVEEIFGRDKSHTSYQWIENTEVLCNKAIQYMGQFRHYQNRPGGRPSSSDGDFWDFVECINQLGDIAVIKKEQGIFLPKEAQIIQDIWRQGFVYLEIHMASEIALKKLNML